MHAQEYIVGHVVSAPHDNVAVLSTGNMLLYRMLLPSEAAEIAVTSAIPFCSPMIKSWVVGRSSLLNYLSNLA